MTDAIPNPPLLAPLPDDVLDLDGLPTLSSAARALFDRACPELAGRSLFLLKQAFTHGQAHVVASHSLDVLITQARLGEAHPPGVFDAQSVVLSTSSDSLAAADRYLSSSLEDIRAALATITPAATLAQFDIDQTTYWEVPDQLTVPNRRLAQEMRARESLAGHTGLLVEAGLLTEPARQLIEQIVRHPRWQDRVEARGVYRVAVRTPGDGTLTRLPGMLILTASPADYDPTLGHVTARQALTGETVVCCFGYLGFVRRHDSLALALTALQRQLTSDDPLFTTQLKCLSVAGQAALLAEREREAGAFELRVVPIAGNPFETLVQQQIEVWQLNALQTGESLWNDRVGLDASMCKVVRMLRAIERQRDAARIAVWGGARTLGTERQAELDTLLEQLQVTQAVADRYFGALPTFEAFASEKIQAALGALGWDVAPSQVQLQITIASYRPDFLESELAPGVVGTDSNAQSSQRICSLLEYVALRMDQASDASWTIELAEPVPDAAQGLPLKAVGEVAEALNLQEQYQGVLAARLQRPGDADEAERFDQSRLAAEALFEARLRLNAWLAHAKRELDDSGYQLIQDVLANPQPQGAAVHGDGLGRMEAMVLAGNAMRDVFLFAVLGESSIVVYMPGHPEGRVLQRYASRGAFRRVLTAQLQGIQADAESLGEQARYWLARFGAHQQATALPAMILLAQGKGGSLLSSVPVVQAPGKAVFEQRLRFLLADADGSAVSDREVQLNQGLDTALTIFRLLSVLLPGRVMTILDLAEVGFFMFKGYASYAAGQRQQAGEYLIEMLTSVGGLVNAKGPRLRPSGKAAAPMRAQLEGSQLSVEALPAVALGHAAMVRLGEGERAGLYVVQRRLYVELEDGQRYPVHEVKDPLDGTLTRYLGDSDVSLAGVWTRSAMPRIGRDPQTAQWRVLPRLRLPGGADQPRVPPARPLHVNEGVALRPVGHVDEYYVRVSGGEEVKVEFDLSTCQWFSRARQRYLRYDRDQRLHAEQPTPTVSASPVERQQARDHFGLPAFPMLPNHRVVDPADLQPLPAHVHQVWIGTAQSLLDSHAATLDLNTRMAKASGYTLEVHFYKAGGLLPESMQMALLRRRFPDVVFTALRNETFFKAFGKSAAGKVFEHFMAGNTQNRAAACDVLRYRLIRELAGIYMDMDDELLKKLPMFSMFPGQLGVGNVVGSRILNFEGFNNSHFASLKGNPLLDAIEREMVERFNATKWSKYRPRQGEDGFSSYIQDISRVTGPRLLNDVYGSSNPRAGATRNAVQYLNDLDRAGVIPEPRVRQWVDQVQDEVMTLSDYLFTGTTGSWMTSRR